MLGPLSYKVTSVIPEFISAFEQLYAHHQVSLDGGYYDFEIAVSPPSIFRRFVRRNAVFQFCGEAPFLPMPVSQAHAMFEWGVNWTIATHLNQHLIFHSAVVEHGGKGVLLSAESGSGKSTLSAELTLQGWRLLSDELAIVDSAIRLIPIPRPISLKNESIPLIQGRHRDARFGPLAEATHKGTIGHMVAPATCVTLNDHLSIPKLIIFPKWSADSVLSCDRVGPGEAALRLIDQSFNYSILGATGFERLVALVRSAQAWELNYSSLDEAREVMEGLVQERA